MQSNTRSKKQKKRCMAYFRSLHSHLQVLLKDDLKGTRIEHGFKRAFMSLFGQDVDTFTRTMLLNVDRLQKQLDKDEFQEDGSMTAFWVVNNQFQNFIDSKFTLDYDSQMTDTRFVQYTGIEVQHFRDTLLQHLGNVKKSVAERTRHLRQYERRVNKRQMQTQESKIDTGKALDADLVDTESIRTDSTVQDDNNRSGNDTDADDADIRPIYDEEPMAEVQLTAECNIFAIGQQHTEQPEIINEGRVDQNLELEAEILKICNNSSSPELNVFFEINKLKDQIQGKDELLRKLKALICNMNKNDILRDENLSIKKRYQDLYQSKAESNSNVSSRAVVPEKPKVLAPGLYAMMPKWKPTGKIFKTVGLRWVPTGKIFTSSTTKVDSESTNGSDEDITNQYEYKQTLDVSAGTPNLSAGLGPNSMAPGHNGAGPEINNLQSGRIGSGLVTTPTTPSVPPTEKKCYYSSNNDYNSLNRKRVNV
ncbi:hypothetical protein Tco_0784208 [Tanacetum coccineum]